MSTKNVKNNRTRLCFRISVLFVRFKQKKRIKTMSPLTKRAKTKGELSSDLNSENKSG